ncbi:MAG: SRPBCC domain-containing protein [Litoreibacter sp.]|nr:SRPBCC domain-containing protein [Litoreibacter sp.]
MSKPIETRIEIAAPPSAVWTELADHAAYAVWNPFITRISGDLAVGERLAVIVQPQGKAAMEFAPEILIADADEELRWVGQLGMKGVFDGEHYFVLEETARGTTVFHHGERFSGLLTYLLFPLIGESTENGFHAMNLALKTRVEARS